MRRTRISLHHRNNLSWICYRVSFLLAPPQKREKKQVCDQKILSLHEYKIIARCQNRAIVSYHTWRNIPSLSKESLYFHLELWCKKVKIPCRRSAFLLGFPIFSGVWIRVLWILVSRSKEYPSLFETIEYSPSFSLHI